MDLDEQKRIREKITENRSYKVLNVSFMKAWDVISDFGEVSRT